MMHKLTFLHILQESTNGEQIWILAKYFLFLNNLFLPRSCTPQEKKKKTKHVPIDVQFFFSFGFS